MSIRRHPGSGPESSFLYGEGWVEGTGNSAGLASTKTHARANRRGARIVQSRFAAPNRWPPLWRTKWVRSFQLGIGAKKQVPQSLPAEQGEPSPPAVFLPVVLQVASLTERHQIARVIVGGVVIPVRCG